MLKCAALAAIALLAATPAFAQSALVEVDDETAVPALNASADALEDMDVTGPGGTRIGEVEAVLGTSPATPTALAVDFDDDASYGDEDRVVPLGEFMSHGTSLMLNTKPEDVAKLGAYED